jgi:hypothetical protein
MGGVAAELPIECQFHYEIGCGIGNFQLVASNVVLGVQSRRKRGWEYYPLALPLPTCCSGFSIEKPIEAALE